MTLSTLNRRAFLLRSWLAGGAAALAFRGLTARSVLSSFSSEASRITAGGYGPLFPTRASNTGETLLALPEGFKYNVLGRAGSRMTDGRPTPAAHDGMASFAVDGALRLVRNHEINTVVGKKGAALGDRSYDDLAGGGTTTLVIDPESREVVRDFVSLSGTLLNCAGGPTPWGTWISCEETVMGSTRGRDALGVEFGGFGKPHGYCFEVAASADGMVAPEPIRQMGRFAHEAVAVDPRTKVVYETEDSPAGQTPVRRSGFYRFVPNVAGKLHAGGRLQMLAIKGKPNYDTRTGQKMGSPLPVTWVDIPNPDPPEAETDHSAVFRQGFAQGAAIFTRLEGCWYGDGRVFFSSTDGGDRGLGQIWEYRPEGEDHGGLRLLFESQHPDVLEAPDNLCVSPRGTLMVCEDGEHKQFIRELTPDGLISDFAMNLAPGFSEAEWAGVTFSPDGKTLFVNIQTPGLTLAIWGPWKSDRG